MSKMITKRQAKKLFKLCMDINTLAPRKQDVSGDLPTMFFKFNGHIGTFQIDIHLNGWYSYAHADKIFTLSGCETYWDKYEDAYKYLKDLKKKMTA